jgi:phosphonate transport system ATP-binding protein
LADEPVASLDPESSRLVMDTLQELSVKFNLTLIVSLHQVEIALRYGKRVIALKQGKCIFDKKVEQLSQDSIQGIYQKEFSSLEPSIIGQAREYTPITGELT